MHSVMPLAETTQVALPLPRSKVKIGLVGLNFGRSIINDIIGTSVAGHFDLIALCDNDEARLQKACPNKSMSLYSKLDDLLADDRIEAIGLFTGPNGRAELIRKIIRSGRDVITTKPLETNADAMLEVLLEAKRLGRVVHGNSPSPLLSQDLKLIKKWVEVYDLGRPVGAHADIWTSYREVPDGSWYDDPARCPAAPIYRLGIYLINDLLSLWGKVEKVQLLQSRLFTGRPTSDNAQLSLLFENQALATIYASFCVNDGNPYRNGLTLNFENGTIYRNTGPAWSASPTGNCDLALVKGHKDQPVVIAEEKVENRSGEYQWEYFAHSIQGEIDPEELTPQAMVEGIRVLQAMTEASIRVG
jgi:predicted dehydrogenase